MDAIPQQTLMHYTKNIQLLELKVARFKIISILWMFGGIHLLVSHVLARIVNNNFANLEKQKRQHSVPVMGGSVVAIA